MVTPDLLTIAGSAVIVTILVQVIKPALAWSDATVSRFGPLLAVALGVLVGTGAALYQGVDVVQGVITGLLAGASSIGIYDTAKTVKG